MKQVIETTLTALIEALIKQEKGATEFVLENRYRGSNLWREDSILILPRCHRAFYRFDEASSDPARYYELSWEAATSLIADAAKGKTSLLEECEFEGLSTNAAWLRRAYKASATVDPREEESLQSALEEALVGLAA